MKLLFRRQLNLLRGEQADEAEEGEKVSHGFGKGRRHQTNAHPLKLRAALEQTAFLPPFPPHFGMAALLHYLPGIFSASSLFSGIFSSRSPTLLSFGRTISINSFY